jgi:uncharacterized protein (DUF1800 family)
MAVAWNFDNAAHLLRRAAFGGTPAEIQAFHDRHTGVADAVAELLGFRPSSKKPPGAGSVSAFNRLKMQRWWLKQMIASKKPADAAHEKLVLFLHNHLVSGANKQPNLKYMAVQNQLFRLNARGNFKTLVRAFNHDPANLYYLDGITNVASNDGVHVNANENFGRELLELFTLGVFQLAPDGGPDPMKPNYTENDVHNMARACTGWVVVKGTKGIFYDPDWDGGRYDDNGDDAPDPMTIFGQSSDNFRIDGQPDDVLDLVFSRTDADGNNQVSMFVARKLWAWYAYPPPAPGLKGLLAGFASIFANAGFELTPLLQAMLSHDEFYSDAAKRRRVRHPVDFVVASLRALGVAKTDGKTVGDSDREMGDQLRIMGMDLFQPPNVAGWPGGLTWINSGTLLARLDFAKNLAGSAFGVHRVVLKPILGPLFGNAAASPGAVVDAIVHRLGLDVGPLALTSTQRTALIAFATDNGARTSLDVSNEFTDDVKVKVRGVLSLVLQSAEYQLL